MISATTFRASRGFTFAAIFVFCAGGSTFFDVPTARAEEPSGLQAAAAMEKALVDTIAKCEKSVVAIAQYRKYKPGKAPARGFRADPFAPELQPRDAVPPQPTDSDFIPTEYGTGVVIDKQGLIVTNYHVLGKSTDDYDLEHWVATADHKLRLATIKATDPRSDLAVLEIDASNLTPIALGDANGVKKGQIVIALGNPYAIARDGEVSASWGIVSNLSRKAGPLPAANPNAATTKTTLHHFGTLIQTDAKLNFGTSGGALVNLKGEMIGLTTSAAAAAGYEQAAGYAIPVDDTFRRALNALKEGREVEYGFLGVSPPRYAEDPRALPSGGMRVANVFRATPAYRAGLRSEDVITHINEQPVRDADHLFLLVGRMAADEHVQMTVLRNEPSEKDITTKRDVAKKIDVTLGKYPLRERPIVTAPEPSWRGLRVEFVTAQPNYQELYLAGKIPDDPCVVITEVAKDSLAASAGLHVGEFITRVGSAEVETPKAFYAAASKLSGPVVLRILIESKSLDPVSGRIEFKPQTKTVPAK